MTARITRRIARLALICIVAGVLIEAGAVAWLKLHESELVFAEARSRLHLLKDLPDDAERISIPAAAGDGLAGLLFHANRANDTGYWILHLHGNADSAFSPWQVRHCQALRRMGFSVLDIDPSWLSASPLPPRMAGATSLRDQEKQAILDALDRCDGKIYGSGGAAASLGLKPTTLYGKMKKLGIRTPKNDVK